MSKPEEDEDVRYRREAFLSALDEQLSSSEAPEVRQQFDRLIGLGIEETEVRRMMASALAVMVWHTLREDAYTYQDYIKDLSGLPANESGHDIVLPARLGIPFTGPEALDDPFFSGLLAEIEGTILKWDREAKFANVALNDSQVRSIVNKVRKEAEGGTPKLPEGSDRDNLLAQLFDELVELRGQLFEEMPGGDPVRLPTKDWLHALRVVEDAIRRCSTGAGSRAYLDYTDESDR